jgi:hypothetical protein
VKALYSTRTNRDLASITWNQLAGSSGQFEAFFWILEQLETSKLGAVTGTIRARRSGDEDPVSWSLQQLSEVQLTPDDRAIDAKLDLQPVVAASEIELIRLYVEDRVNLGNVPLRATDSGWAIVGRPEGTEPESLLFAEVYFDLPSPQTSMVFSFGTKTDLWLSYGLDGEPTGRENRVNRTNLCKALIELADRTRGELELEELAIEAPEV